MIAKVGGDIIFSVVGENTQQRLTAGDAQQLGKTTALKNRKHTLRSLIYMMKPKILHAQE